MKIKTLILATAMFVTATGFAVAQNNNVPEAQHDGSMTKGTMSKDIMPNNTMSKDKMAKDHMSKDKMNGSANYRCVSPASSGRRHQTG